ncbi:hypothetical protein E3P92_02251 [Wallemia ichthyophaga]|uniref:Transaldolase n=1 Tax=Wallemia ichthyophaga (strain EXF-994 / CBS 113033) TaxID=1299270 RepID=R9AIL5_WALI9|nr:Transaldolase [Wallemia ichthyophaga EXF-994]TIA72402.1 hypothetical protein E3P91_02002 [Wallemia ichthyophaga]EOR01955.1 Transaldolase [Wallemia ichthyophaga EXF-994]TIA81762.1 hypothetical protein E3P98_01806 [Wallemia ichthyophaga]TIA91215.1 hypothetical protein E3P97_02117 [Wallemia ichthyophaga]TIB04642.1 hypothetical protein E3P96_01584 [Wallemia ichthyophaga]
MTSLLDAIRDVTTIDLDAIDVDVVTKYAPFRDMTCNQFIVQSVLTMPEHAHVLAFAVDEALKSAKEFGVDVTDSTSFEQLVVDIASVNVIKEIKPRLHPQGLVLLQTCCSKLGDVNDIVKHCEQIVKTFEKYGISSKECCIKVPATVNGLKACKLLSQSGVNTLATTVFCTEQALAAAEAGCVAISPYLNELDAHFNRKFYVDYANPAKESPGVKLTHKIQRYYRTANIKTQVKAASFIAPIDAVAMAGVDAITVGPTILEGLANTQVNDQYSVILKDAIAASREQEEIPEQITWLDEQANRLTAAMEDPQVKRLQGRANEVFTNAEEQLRALAKVAILNKRQPHPESL